MGHTHQMRKLVQQNYDRPVRALRCYRKLLVVSRLMVCLLRCPDRGCPDRGFLWVVKVIQEA